MTKFETIERDLRDKISSGAYKTGDRLPTTPELCELYGVSKITVKRAMDELTHAGLVTRRRGSGTYVTGVTQGFYPKDIGWNAASRITGFSAECAASGKTASVHVHEFVVLNPPQDVAQALSLGTMDPCFRITRTLLADNVAQLDEISYVPYIIAPELSKHEAEHSIFSYIENDLGLSIASSHRQLMATHPGPDAAERLGIPPDAPVLKIVQTSYLDDGRPFELSISIHTPGYEYHAIRTY